MGDWGEVDKITIRDHTCRWPDGPSSHRFNGIDFAQRCVRRTHAARGDGRIKNEADAHSRVKKRELRHTTNNS